MANQPTHASLSLPTTPGRGQELRREDEVYEWAWASQVLLDTGPEGQYYLLGCREPDQDDNTRPPSGNLSPLPSLSNHNSPLWFIWLAWVNIFSP